MTGSSPEPLAGPPRGALLVLALSALALMATSASRPPLIVDSVAEAAIGPGEVVQRELRVHLDPTTRPPSGGFLTLGFQTAIGLGPTYTDLATIEVVEAHDARGALPSGGSIPIDRCAEGCDLTYRLAITAAPVVLPGSTVRYTTHVEFRFDDLNGTPDPAWLTAQLDGSVPGTATPTWAYLAGVLALIAGIAAGPLIARRFGTPWARRAAIALAIAIVAPLIWVFAMRLIWFVGALAEHGIASPLYLFFLVDWWSIALLVTLAWGIRRGLRRREEDGGWLLGLAAAASVGLGGLWLGYAVGDSAVLQPVVAMLSFVVLGLLGGVVIGEAWRTDPRAHHDRWWAATAVVAHGIVIAGFGFLVWDGFARSSTASFALLVPAGIVALLLRRWFRGGRAALILVDLVIAAIGLLGGFLTGLGGSVVGSTYPSRFELQNLGVLIAVLAAVAALITACHQMPRPAHPAPPGASPAAPEPAPATS